MTKQQQEYQRLLNRLADLGQTTPAAVARDIARDANAAGVRPLLIARKRLHAIRSWSFQKITNAACKDGAPLSALPHESVAPLARAMKNAAKYGGTLRDHYRKQIASVHREHGLVPPSP